MDNAKYQKLLGSLLYISVNSRPDIAACVSYLVQQVSEPNQEDWNGYADANRAAKVEGQSRDTFFGFHGSERFRKLERKLYG